MAAKKRVVLILHGKASNDERVRDALQASRDMGHRIEVKITLQPGDAERFAKAAAEEAGRGEIDTVIAGGGDGTLNAVIRGAMEETDRPMCTFGLLPLGTANDFARNAGIPADPVSALEIALHTEPRAIDVACLEARGDIGKRRFVNMLTAGFGPRVTSEADPQLKARLGGAAYLLSALGRIGEVTPWDGRIDAPGFEWEGSFAALAVGNGRRAGGGIELCPVAELDDGQLDLTVIEAPDGDVIGGLLSSLPMALGAEPDSVVRARADRFEIAVEQPVPVSLDGEMLEADRFSLSVDPKAIRFHLDVSRA